MLPWIFLGYAVGSVPFAFLVARRAGIDVRVAGSGNVGAANVLRTSGTPLGVTVMALDISKGVGSVLAALATIVAAAVFFSTVLITRIISMGSMAATVSLPWIAWLSGAPTSVLIAAIGIAVLILFRHRANMRRIAHGTERRVGDPR